MLFAKISKFLRDWYSISGHGVRETVNETASVCPTYFELVQAHRTHRHTCIGHFFV
jgi:hypothetical protein